MAQKKKSKRQSSTLKAGKQRKKAKQQAKHPRKHYPPHLKKHKNRMILTTISAVIIIALIVLLSSLPREVQRENFSGDLEAPQKALSHEDAQDFSKGKESYEQKNLTEALMQFQEVENPQVREFWSAKTFAAMGNHEQAVRLLERAKEFSPDNLALKMLLAEEYQYIQEREKSIAIAQQVLEQDPNNIKAHYVIGGNAFNLLDYQTAIEEFNKTIELMPDYNKLSFEHKTMLSKIVIIFGGNDISDKYVQYRTLYNLEKESGTISYTKKE